MADQGAEWTSPSGAGGDGQQTPPPRYGERVPEWAPPSPPQAAPPPSGYAAPQPPPGYSAPRPPAGAYVPPPRPGLVPLHPLSFGRILGTAFAVIRYNPRATVVPALILSFVQNVLTLVLVGAIGFSAVDRLDNAVAADQDAILAGVIAEGVAGGLFVIAVTIFCTSLLQGMIVPVVARGALGERPTAMQALRVALGRIWPLIGVSLLLGVLQAVAITVLVVLVIGIASLGDLGIAVAIIVGILGGLAFLAAYLFLAVKLATVPSAIVLEHLGVFAAIGRSWVLLRGAFWRTAGVLVLVTIAVSTVTQLVGLPFSVLSGAFGGVLFPNMGEDGDFESSILPLIITTVPSTLVTAVVAGIGQVALVSAVVVVYLDQRMRREGLDLEMQRYVEQGGRDPFERTG